MYITVGIPSCRTVADPVPDVDTREDQIEALRVLSAGNTIIIALLGGVLALQASPLSCSFSRPLYLPLPLPPFHSPHASLFFRLLPVRRRALGLRLFFSSAPATRLIPVCVFFVRVLTCPCLLSRLDSAGPHRADNCRRGAPDRTDDGHERDGQAGEQYSRRMEAKILAEAEQAEKQKAAGGAAPAVAESKKDQ